MPNKYVIFYTYNPRNDYREKDCHKASLINFSPRNKWTLYYRIKKIDIYA
ncbi:MAG: hypothetical protein V3T59_04080 [Desulfobacterales bacterium]